MASHHKNLSDFSHIKVASAAPYRFGIVVSQWNAEVTGSLLDGAFEALIKHGAHEEHIRVAYVPGSYELTAGADILFRDSRLDAVICLGCVIQGETKHFDFICSAVAHGITNVALKQINPLSSAF